MTVIGPGVRVKCVNHGNGVAENAPMVFPPIGSVWTVGRVCNHPVYGRYISLVEWPRKSSLFNPVGFVPLDGNEDISVFTEMLTKLPAKTKELVGGLL